MPQVTAIGPGKLLLSWQTPLSGGGYTFAMATGDGSHWSEVRRIDSGPKLSMYSADLPGVAPLPNGALLAYWESKDATSKDPYGTAIKTSVSRDAGKTWSPVARPYRDLHQGQHSFLSWFPLHDGVGLAWLDAQQQAVVRERASHSAHNLLRQSMSAEDTMGSVGLRYAALNREGRVTSDSFIDPITCECCPTSAALTSQGPVVVYRNREELPGTKPDEVRVARPTVRDIYLSRFDGTQWSTPHPVHSDHWVINACPDNGPAVAAKDNALAVAWWTRADDEPRVQVAFSSDSGDSFGPPIRVDRAKGEGQVTLALLKGGKSAVVGWLEDGRTWARLVSADNSKADAVLLGPSPNHSRLPKWIAENDGVTAVWTSRTGGVNHIEVSQLALTR